MTDHTELRKLATDAIAAANGDWMHTDGSQNMARERALVLYTYAVEPATILSLLDRLEKAEKDAARLDWLEQNIFNIENVDWITGKVSKTHSARRIIDAAMEASK